MRGDELSRDPENLNTLLVLMQSELKRVARSQMRKERHNHTLQPTALVNEVYLRLVRQGDFEWKDRSEFLGVAARVMRQVLIDHARLHNAEKRGGGQTLVAFDELIGRKASEGLELTDILTVDALLTELEGMDPRQARIVELKFFGGLTIREVAELIGVSHGTVESDWKIARLWFRSKLARRKAEDSSP